MARCDTFGNSVIRFSSDTDMNTIVVGQWILVNNIEHFNSWANILSVDSTNRKAVVDQMMMSTRGSLFQISATDPNAGSGGGSGGGSNVIGTVQPYWNLVDYGWHALSNKPTQASESVKLTPNFNIDLVAGKKYKITCPIHYKMTAWYSGYFGMLIDLNSANPYTDYQYVYEAIKHGSSYTRQRFDTMVFFLNPSVSETRTYEIRVTGSEYVSPIYLNPS